MDGQRFGRSFAPVREGEELDVKIEAVGEKGDGIARVKGFVLFVPGTKEGDEVKVKISKVLRRVGFAEVIGEGKVEGKTQTETTTEETKEEPVYDESLASEDFGEEETKEEAEETKEKSKTKKKRKKLKKK